MLLVTILWPFLAGAGEPAETRELVGQVGSRSALMVLHATQRPDGGWQVAGEYVLLPTLAWRYLEGERSPEIGVTSLKEGTTPILFGRPPIGELRGTWRQGWFKGTRYGPGGQERERFELSEDFPSMEAYSAQVSCELSEGRYRSSLSYDVREGKLKAFEWRSRVEPAGHVCALLDVAQQEMKGGIAAGAGECRVTMRDLGEFVRLAAGNCADVCGSQAYFEPLLIDRRGHCRLLRPESR
jgi:hypothetical protein